MIHDRDRIFSKHLHDSIKALGLKVLRSPVASPKANAICERVIGTIRRECLDWVIPLSEAHLRVLLKEWTAHYNRGRCHSALGPGVPDPPEEAAVYPQSGSRHRLAAGALVVAKSVLAACITNIRLQRRRRFRSCCRGNRGIVQNWSYCGPQASYTSLAWGLDHARQPSAMQPGVPRTSRGEALLVELYFTPLTEYAKRREGETMISVHFRPRTAAVAVTLSVLSAMVFGAAADDARRRQEISDKGKSLFRNTTNHCKAFRDLVAFAITKSNATGVVLEDLKFVLIGEDLRRRGTGPYYIGGVPGARGDKGFKPELRDNSPQVEHAMAAIYVGKNLPPGSAEAAALLTEIAQPLENGQKVNGADVLLWSIGGDAGQRVSDRELNKLPDVIDRTMCGS